MDAKHCLLGMEIGACQSFENMAVFPLRFSGNVMAPGLRQVNMQEVHASLRSGRRFDGDQCAVWDGIARMHELAQVDSMTGAMRDVIGSALALNGGIIHMAFFRTLASGRERVDEMATLDSRRRFRT